MDVLEAMQNRHSVRRYTGEPVPDEVLTKILQAGLLSESGKGLRPWEFIVVRDRETLEKMSVCRSSGSGMLKWADAAVVVIADGEATDVWTEDCSVAMANMHLEADSLGIGSCWIQGRLRTAPDGGSTEDYLRELLGFPEKYRLGAILSLGMPAKHAPKTTLESLPMEKVHYGRF